jgi:cytochrome c peroxidase
MFRAAKESQRLYQGIALAVLILLLGGCGGSGSGGNIPPPVQTQLPSPPPPAAPVDHPPVLSQANALQHAVYIHPFRYDATQGGKTFSDPDGDPLSYEITIGHTYNPYNDPNPPAGLHIEGTSIVGEPAEVGVVVVVITAKDSAGNTVSDEFNIVVAANGIPAVVNANDGALVSVGTAFDYDAAKAGTAFSDPDGDALTYNVSLRGQTGHLTINGSHVTGQFDAAGLAEVTITAQDGYGGSASDVFTIAAPAPEPGKPTLPAAAYQYDDHELTLPYIFKLSSDSVIPLWDTQPADNRTTDAGATLGRVLFYDKRLSSTNTAACATCHQQQYGFASPEAFSSGPLGVPTKRNVMALANVRYNINNAWFSDLRVDSLAELSMMPIANPEELGISLRLLVAKLAAVDFYPPLFQAAFGTPEVTQERIGKALEQYLQSLISYRTKFDLAYNSMDNGPLDPSLVLNAQELRGLDLFQGKGGIACTGCHELSAQTNVWQANNGLDAIPTDLGTQVPALQRDGSQGVFRAASLRNIAVSGPYMHDGRFATIRDVIDHYDHGIVDSRNLDAQLRDSSGKVRQMNLSEQDKDALEAFLRTFTDDTMLADPKFSDPFQ